MTCNTEPIVAWLADGARSAAQPEQVLAELCDRLVRCGVSLWSAAVFVPTPHPDVSGRKLLWRVGSGVTVEEIPFERFESSEFRNGPVGDVQASAVAIRRRLLRASDAGGSPLLRSLHAQAVSDLLAVPLIFTDGTVHVATWTTRSPGGFSDDQIAAIEAITAPATRVAEIKALTRTTHNLLNAYVGSRSGERILAGQIRRGYSESIHAAILLSDMRGFTRLADRLPPPTLVALLNRYFDCQVPAILDRGGEVLKFMGDGLLAIFPVSSGEQSVSAVCRAALSAACEMRSSVAKLSRSIEGDGIDELRFGLALHVGALLYGNIGGGGRLDFTCIGPAINLAARLEKLAGAQGRSIIASRDFAVHCNGSFLPLGEFALAGFHDKQMLYGLSDEFPRAVRLGVSELAHDESR